MSNGKKENMILTTELILGIIGTVTGVISLIISCYFNNKLMKQTDRNLKTQLLYQDTKQALVKLRKIIDESEDYYKLKQNVQDFLNSFEGNYIPNEVIQNLNNELGKLKTFYGEKNPYPPDQMSEEEYNYECEKAKRITMVDQVENFEYDLGKEVDSFKHSMKNLINNNALKYV